MEAAIGRRGPPTAGLDALVFGTAELIEKHTGRVINRSTKAKTGDLTDVQAFHDLYKIAQLAGGVQKKLANVEASMRRYITRRNRASGAS